MSPEQARGETADRRTDIWAFGVVLWEMLTGRRLFEGRTVSDTLAGILRDDIDVGALSPACPASLRQLVRRCLERDPDRRLHDIADARIMLEDIVAGIDDGPVSEVAAGSVPPRRRSEEVAWALATTFLLAALATTWLATRGGGKATRARSVRASLLPPEGTAFAFGDKHVGSLALSPDGSRLVFSAVSESRRSDRLLYLRRLDSTTATPLTGTEGATFPFWSPDGEYIAFFSAGKLRKIPVSGGAPLAICDAVDGRGGTWSPEGVIVFAPGTQGPLHAVSASGGRSTPVTEIDAESTDSTHRVPFFLPDGRRFLYKSGTGIAVHSYKLWIGSLDSAESVFLFETPAKVIYSGGHLLFIRDGFLMAQRFDPGRGTLEGEPFFVAERVNFSQDIQAASFTAAEPTTLAYFERDQSELELVMTDRQGDAVATVSEPGAYRWVRLSPDGNRIVAAVSEASAEDLWVLDVTSGSRSRLTFEPGLDTQPVWSPDGARIAYATARTASDRTDIAARRSTGGGEAEILLATDDEEAPWDWSANGEFITVNRRTGADMNLWILPVNGDEPFPLVGGDAMQGWGSFSPDGQWVAYLSNESGDWQLFATRFPDGGGRWQLTSDAEGAYWLIDWLEDGLYTITSDLTLAVLNIEMGHGFIRPAGRQRSVIQTSTIEATNWASEVERVVSSGDD